MCVLNDVYISSRPWPTAINAQNKYMAYQTSGKRSEKIANLPEIVSFMYQKAHKMSAVSKWAMLRPHLVRYLGCTRSSNRILLPPFDSVFVSCELICGIEWPLIVIMLFLYPHPYPFKDGSHGENECSNSWTLDGT